MSVNLNTAERKKLEREQRLQDKKMKEAADALIAGKSGRLSKWTRKTVAIDDEIIEAMDTLCEKERKLFSQLAREFFIAGLKAKGVELE